MGATTFFDRAYGRTAQEAFDNAVRQARYEYGHRGYTGSLAEKNSFVMISLPADTTAEAFARKLVEEGDDRIDDKWGPAGCIKDDNGFLFFGWASC